MSPRLLALAALIVLCATPIGAAPATCSQVLVLGPLPLAATPLGPDGPMAPELTALEGLDVHAMPRAGDTIAIAGSGARVWTERALAGGLGLESAGAYWLAVRVHLARWTAVSFEIESPGSVEAWLGGRALGAGELLESGRRRFETEARRGAWPLLLRVTIPNAAPNTPAVLEGQAEQGALAFSLNELVAPSHFDLIREAVGLRHLVVAPGGSFVAGQLRQDLPRGDETSKQLEVWAANGQRVASGLGGNGAHALTFSPDGERLALAVPAEGGEKLALWTSETKRLTVFEGVEPSLADVHFDPSGRLLLFRSARGAKQATRPDTGAHRWAGLREKLPDYPTAPHLHLLDLESGARRRLTLPGDFVLDDACFLDRERVLYARTLPVPEHPYFVSELRTIALESGEDRHLATFRAGWEVRPSGFVAEPGGARVAFFGPPAEVTRTGRGARQNVYNKQIWLLDTASGHFERITVDMPYAFSVRYSTVMQWRGDGRSLVSVATKGARRLLVELGETESGWEALELPHAGESFARAGIAPDGSAVALSATSLTAPDELALVRLEEGRYDVLARPNAALLARWRVASPSDASFTGPSGETIEGWYYPPLVALDKGKTPLVVYYYGGNSPRVRGFDVMHQVLAGNGYGVFVLNPRGAFGRGDAFADHHAGDWGPKAAADVLAGIDALLEAHPELHPHKIGIYGGSYGGFLTNYLLTITERFGAAVSMYGISDLATYWGQGEWGYTYADMALATLRPFDDPGYFVEHSPLFAAEKITTPILFLHGLKDRNVTPGESEQLYTALRVQDKEAEYVVFPDEAHGIAAKVSHYVLHRMLLIDYFDKHLRLQPEAWDTRFGIGPKGEGAR